MTTIKQSVLIWCEWEELFVTLAGECGSTFSCLPYCLVCSINKWLLCPCLCDYGMQLGKPSLHTEVFCVTVYIYPWPPLQPSDLCGLKRYPRERRCGLDIFFSLWPWFGKSLAPSRLGFVLSWQVFCSQPTRFMASFRHFLELLSLSLWVAVLFIF